MTRVMVFGFLSLACAWGFKSKKRDTFVIFGGTLPLYLSAIVMIFGLMVGLSTALKQTFLHFFSMFIHIGLYDALLLLGLWWLRQKISARACALLWLLPNLLYLAQFSWLALPQPIFVMPLPAYLMDLFYPLWLCGFGAVMAYHLIGHFIFRYRLLKRAKPISDPLILAQWQDALQESKLTKNDISLVASPVTQTPLSIGLFQRTICVVLPERAYSAAECRFIFRHELIHIQQKDAWTKLFMVFCVALQWFNPLAWIAKRRSSEDLELSCDQSVVQNEDEKARHQYAQLLLETAGDQHGFTSCLATSAKSLRYRLIHLIHPGQRFAGTILVGVVCFMMMNSYGFVTFAWQNGNGAQFIYQEQDPASYQILSIMRDQTAYDCQDEVAFQQYFSQLTLYQLSDDYSYKADASPYIIIFESADTRLGMTVSDHELRLVDLDGRNQVRAYYLADGLDWSLLERILIPK